MDTTTDLTTDTLEQQLVTGEATIAKIRNAQMTILREIDRRQTPTADGSRSMAEWVTGRRLRRHWSPRRGVSKRSPPSNKPPVTGRSVSTAPPWWHRSLSHPMTRRSSTNCRSMTWPGYGVFVRTGIGSLGGWSVKRSKPGMWRCRRTWMSRRGGSTATSPEVQADASSKPSTRKPTCCLRIRMGTGPVPPATQTPCGRSASTPCQAETAPRSKPPHRCSPSLSTPMTLPCRTPRPVWSSKPDPGSDPTRLRRSCATGSSKSPHGPQTAHPSTWDGGAAPSHHASRAGSVRWVNPRGRIWSTRQVVPRPSLAPKRQTAIADRRAPGTGFVSVRLGSIVEQRIVQAP